MIAENPKRITANLLKDKTCDSCINKLLSNYPSNCLDSVGSHVLIQSRAKGRNTCEDWGLDFIKRIDDEV